MTLREGTTRLSPRSDLPGRQPKRDTCLDILTPSTFFFLLTLSACKRVLRSHSSTLSMSMGSARRSGRRREASLVVLSDSDDAPSRKRRRDEKASDAKKTPSRASTNKGSRSKRSRVSSDSSDSDEIVYVVASRAASTASTSNTTHKSKQPKVGPSTLARKSTAPKRRNIEEEVPEVTPRKLVNGDGAAAVRSSQDNGVKRTPGSSFKERLKENEKSSPRFSQSFIGKAKSRNNHSIVGH